MKKIYFVFLIIIILFLGAFFYLENEYMFLNKKEYNEKKVSDTFIVYIKKDFINDVKNKIKLFKLKKEENVYIYQINKKDNNNLLFIKNGKVTHKLKKINIKKIKQYIDEMNKDVCSNKNGC